MHWVGFVLLLPVPLTGLLPLIVGVGGVITLPMFVFRVHTPSNRKKGAVHIVHTLLFPLPPPTLHS